MKKNSTNELIRENLKYIIDSGTTYKAGSSNSVHSNRNFREIIGSHSVLLNPRNRIFTSNIDNKLFDPGLASARLIYLLSGSNELEPISFYSQGVDKFSDDGKTIAGSAYGHRIFRSKNEDISQMDKLINILQEQRNSTRGSISLYDSEDCGRESKDIPCALNFTFSPRDDILHATLTMRANACLRLMPYNVFEFTMLQEWVANRCKFVLGQYHHSVISLHIRDDELVITPDIVDEQKIAPSMSDMPQDSGNMISDLLDVEKVIRKESRSWNNDTLLFKMASWNRDYGEYWGDIINSLALRAFRITHCQSKVSNLLKDLLDVQKGPLLAITRDIYDKS